MENERDKDEIVDERDELLDEDVDSREEEHEKEEDNNLEELEDTQVIRRIEPERKKKKGIKAVVIILILILICVLGYAAYTNFVQKKSKSIKNDNVDYESSYRLSGNGLEDFDLYFMKLENNKINSVYSPLSIKYALAMLSEGAGGDTKEQIDAIIGDYKAKSYPNNSHMSFANAMFIRDSYKDAVKDEYTNNLKEKFGADVVIDSFANPDNINNWVNDRTFKLINNLLDDVSDNDFFLINALAIDMNWNNQIHCALGHEIPCVNDGSYHIEYSHEKLEDADKNFYSVTEYPYSDYDFYRYSFNGKKNSIGATVLADFNKYDIIKDLGEDKIRETIKPKYEEWLKTEEGKNDLPLEQGLDRFINELKENYGKAANSTDFLVHEDNKVKVFAKDLKEYDGVTLQYVGIMPKNEELSDFIENINSSEINNILKRLKEVKLDNFEEGYVTRIRGYIPFFKFEYELKLMEDLKKLGIKDAFDDKADFSNMVKGKSSIDKAIHKANIEFSNDGIKAAAATAEGGAGGAQGPYFEYLFKVPVKNIDVNFDKPYMYIIRDKDSGEVWFAGTVYESLKK